MSDERSQCAVVFLAFGKPVRCGSMTAQRVHLQMRGPAGEWLQRDDGRAALVSHAVCSKHRALAESRGLHAIDPASAGEVVQ